MMNYVYVYIHTHTTISFSITAYKLSFAFLDVGVYLWYIAHFCAETALEISKGINASSRQLVARNQVSPALRTSNSLM